MSRYQGRTRTSISTRHLPPPSFDRSVASTSQEQGFVYSERSDITSPGMISGSSTPLTPWQARGSRASATLRPSSTPQPAGHEYQALSWRTSAILACAGMHAPWVGRVPRMVISWCERGVARGKYRRWWHGITHVLVFGCEYKPCCVAGLVLFFIHTLFIYLPLFHSALLVLSSSF
jgi:hypothetical protein